MPPPRLARSARRAGPALESQSDVAATGSLPRTDRRRRIDLSGLVDLVLPRACAGCAGPSQSLCPECVDNLIGACFDGGPVPALPYPPPLRLQSVWAAAAYEGTLTTVLRAYKDDGRRDLLPWLSALLEQSLTALILVRGVPAGSIVVPLPSSVRANRFRGDRPVEALVADAAGRVGLSTVRGLGMRRRVRDAVGLRSAERMSNIADAMAGDARLLTGQQVVLADDIMTTGASMAEAQRAVRSAGGVVVGRVVVASAARTVMAESLPFPSQLG